MCKMCPLYDQLSTRNLASHKIKYDLYILFQVNYKINGQMKSTGFSDESETQILLRESVRKAKQKLQSLGTHPTAPTPQQTYTRFDTFSSKNLAKCFEEKEDHSLRETFKRDRTEMEEPLNAEYLRDKNRQLLIENVGLKDSNMQMEEKLQIIEKELESTKRELISARNNYKTAKEEKEAYRNAMDSMVSQLHKELDLKKKITEKYQAQSTKYQQEKKQTQNYCRQLANQYTVLLNSHSKQQQSEKEQGQRYQHRINILSKELSSIKNILLKGQQRQFTSRDRYESKKDEQLTSENIRLLKKIKSMKIEQEKLKAALTHANKEIEHLRKDQYVREQKLQKCEKSHEHILHQAAKNGLTISHKMLQKSQDSRCHRKSQSQKKPKTSLSRSKSAAGKENMSVMVNKKRLLL